MKKLLLQSRPKNKPNKHNKMMMTKIRTKMTKTQMVKNNNKKRKSRKSRKSRRKNKNRNNKSNKKKRSQRRKRIRGRINDLIEYRDSELNILILFYFWNIYNKLKNEDGYSGWSYRLAFAYRSIGIPQPTRYLEWSFSREYYAKYCRRL